VEHVQVLPGPPALVVFSRATDLCCYAVLRQYEKREHIKEWDMSKNHYSTKPKRRNRSGKRKDTRRIAENMAKIKELERSSAPTK
jgi:hypothetical protein